MKQSISLLVVTWVFSLVAVSQNATPKGGPSYSNRTEQKSSETAVEENDGYVIGPEDVLSIVVFREDQLSTRVTVRADGKIALVLLDEVQASGLTPRQLKETITNGLKKFLNDPQVYVIPIEIHSQFVSIVGSVSHPGVYPLGTPLRVTELLVRAGGLTEYAKADQIIIIRSQTNLSDRYPFNYKTFLEGKNYKQDIQLRSRDMVIVP
jgi:polysaccharide export outer membrane protein